MTHPWVMDNNCVKLYPDRTREYEVMAQTQCEQTEQMDGQTGVHGTDRVIPIYPPTLFAGGIMKGKQAVYIKIVFIYTKNKEIELATMK